MHRVTFLFHFVVVVAFVSEKEGWVIFEDVILGWNLHRGV